jgi:hypothetical protein
MVELVVGTYFPKLPEIHPTPLMEDEASADLDFQ